MHKFCDGIISHIPNKHTDYEYHLRIWHSRTFTYQTFRPGISLVSFIQANLRLTIQAGLYKLSAEGHMEHKHSGAPQSAVAPQQTRTTAQHTTQALWCGAHQSAVAPQHNTLHTKNCSAN